MEEEESQDGTRARLRAAARLLRRYGYTVIPPHSDDPEPVIERPDDETENGPQDRS